MSHNSGDLRVRRTQKLIREALIGLIEERSFDAITVGEIAERAMVSRAAFYRYYQDKYDLVEKIFEEMVDVVRHDMEPLRKEATSNLNPESTWTDLFGRVAESQPTPRAWVHLFEHIAVHERLYRALLGKHGSATIAAKMQMYLANTLRERLQNLATALHDERIIRGPLFTSGFVPAMASAQILEAITWWLEEGQPFTPEQIATYSYCLMNATLRETSQWE